MDQDFKDMDSEGRWQNLYIEIRNQSHECPLKVAKYPENRNRNRYRDVSPFDHSRVKLENTENDYINASLVVMEEAQRSYILTQGPLRNTCGHFWLMIWEQNTKAVIMLNRVIEKGSEKCAQYWPTQDEHEMSFRDTHFLITLVSEDVKSYYTTRVLELQNDKTGEKREIYHFHYTTWPDFGVPESPASFLNFLTSYASPTGPSWRGPSTSWGTALYRKCGVSYLKRTRTQCLILNPFFLPSHPPSVPWRNTMAAGCPWGKREGTRSWGRERRGQSHHIRNRMWTRAQLMLARDRAMRGCLTGPPRSQTPSRQSPA